MASVYVLFPPEYNDLDHRRAFPAVEEMCGKEFGQEMHVLGFQIRDRPVPAVMDPSMIMSVIQSAGEDGIDLTLVGQNVQYATMQCPPGITIGMCVFSNKKIKKRRFWRR